MNVTDCHVTRLVYSTIELIDQSLMQEHTSTTTTLETELDGQRWSTFEATLISREMRPWKVLRICRSFPWEPNNRGKELTNSRRLFCY